MMQPREWKGKDHKDNMAEGGVSFQEKIFGRPNEKRTWSKGHSTPLSKEPTDCRSGRQARALDKRGRDFLWSPSTSIKVGDSDRIRSPFFRQRRKKGDL